MRFLILAVVILAAVYGGYWFVGRAGADRGIGAAIAVMERNGWQVDLERRATRGFPSRFDTTVTAPRIVSPAGWGWTAPFLQILALAWAPTQVIAVLPPDQGLILPDHTALVLTAEGLRASARVRPGLALPLDNLTVESGPVRLNLPGGGLARLDRALFALREAGPAPATYDLFAEVSALTLSDVLPGRVPARLSSEGFGLIRLDAAVALSRPLDRSVLSGDWPEVTGLTIRSASIGWGAALLSGSGSLALVDGLPEGELRLAASGWGLLLDLAAEAGLVPPQAALLLRGLGEEVEVPLSLRDGLMWLGPAPLGAAPRF